LTRTVVSAPQLHARSTGRCPLAPARPESIIAAAPAAGGIAAIVGVLEVGARNEAVRALQFALAKLGYPMTATGYFGDGTDTVVKDFQARHGLASDGVVGPATAAAIDRAVAEKDRARPALATDPTPG
jgi:peptidoglycan hydrolase-like protein with peptidoglycan-binding domain